MIEGLQLTLRTSGTPRYATEVQGRRARFVPIERKGIGPVLGSVVSPEVVGGNGPFPSCYALARKWTSQLSSTCADGLMAALQCGRGPYQGRALGHESLQPFIVIVDHGLAIRRISMAEVHRTNRKDGSADPNEDGGSLFGNDWCRFHDQITAMRSIGSAPWGLVLEGGSHDNKLI
jgi:hypothetical protein